MEGDWIFGVGRYEGSSLLGRDEISANGSRSGERYLKIQGFSGGGVKLAWERRGEEEMYATFRYSSVVDGTIPASPSPPLALSVAMHLMPWDADDVYVIIPSAVYAGNRFQSFKIPYSPRIPAHLAKPECPIVINDVPRLSRGDQSSHNVPSRLQILARDSSCPAVGIFSRRMKVAWLIWIKDHQVSGLGEFGIEVTEEPNGTGKVRFSIPGIRESMMYWQTAIDKSSNDKGISLSHESLVTIRVSAVRFAADKISDVWERLWAIRGTMCDDVQPNRQTQMSLSAAAEIIEKKFNLENWNEELGLYSSAVVSTDHKFYFQSGWTGSMMVTLPLALNCVEPRTRQRAIQNVRTFLTQAVIPSSKLFHGRLAADLKKWTHDYTFDARPGTEHFQRLTLVRRQVDCLYFLLRQLSLFRIALGFCAPESWTIVLREACDALVSTWKRCGQLGFFLDAETGDVAIGNSASASLFPAALVHAAELFDDPGYWNLSLTVAEKLHQTFIDDLGLTCGGPGDALMCADSESAYYLLESLVCIAEKGKSAGLSQHVIKLWVEKARQVAALFATWVVSYDFRFPPESVFGKTEMKTNGTVWANVQNKHSSVGVCTNSGSALLRLFRLTEDERYLTLLSDITSALAQFVSREDRLLYSFDGYANPSGWVNERVNLSDWDPPGPGGIIHESSWCEVTILLSALEIPGIYVDSTNSVVYCLDVVQVTSSSFRRHDGMCTIECSILNPSKFPALVRIMIESREQRRLPLEDGYFLRLEKVSIPAGGEITLHRALPVSNTNS